MKASDAGGFPVIFFTAYYPLFELLRLRPGMKVLVHSAAGGVGSALVQLAKLAGTEVTAVVGAPHKVEAARALGADHVIDKSSEELWSAARAYAPQGFDIVLDANGVSTLKQSYKALARGGRLVIYGFHSMIPRTGGRPKLAYDFLRTPRFNPLDLTNDNKSVLAFNLSDLFDRVDLIEQGMRELLEWHGQGKIRLPKVTPYAFENVADAHRAIESGQTVGKLILTH
jgi:NADPH:quinone reductase-like Zn-dependent oxidoreductase